MHHVFMHVYFVELKPISKVSHVLYQILIQNFVYYRFLTITLILVNFLILPINYIYKFRIYFKSCIQLLSHNITNYLQ